MPDFFISYTRADRGWAVWIAWTLEKVGYKTRVQEWDIPPGSSFPAEMQKATTECKRTLAVLSPDYLDSAFGTSEWLAAFVQDPLGEDRKLVPVRVREMRPSGLLAGIVYIDLVGLSEAAAQEELVEGVAKGRERAKPEEKPKFPGAQRPEYPGPFASLPGVDEALTRVREIPLDTVPEPSPLPTGSRMPHAVNPMFVGRDEDLRELAKALKVGESAAIGQIAVATGMGGIGKTQLASEFVHRYGRFFEGGVFWMSFADSAAVPTEVAACGQGLGRREFADLPLDRQVQLVRDSWQSPLPRLLVFDNCEDPELLQRWRPTSGRARVLLTSRRSRWDLGFGIHPLPLGMLSRSASVELLRRFCPAPTKSDAVLGEIAEELGDLPLALHLAGSFLKRFQYAPFGQLQLYLEELRRGDLLDHPSFLGHRAGFIPTNHDDHVARTFALSYERLDSEYRVDGLAQRLLARASYFAPGEPIPRELLLATLQLSLEDPASMMNAEEALGKLIDLGLVEEAEGGRITMHRLVAYFVQGKIVGLEDQQAVEWTLCQEADRLNNVGYPAALLAWQPHLRAVVQVAFARDDEASAALCNELGFHLRAIGEYPAARSYFERALVIREKVKGPEHLTTAVSLNNLGGLLQDLGDLSAARPHYERALAIREKVQGPEHPDTALILNNLGSLLQDIGELPGARLNLERALAIWEKVLGPQHSNTALILNNLGTLLQTTGDLSGARLNLERSLAIWEKVLEPEHPNMALILNNLGNLHLHLGELSDALPYLEGALVTRQKMLGPEHPDTAFSLNILGRLLHERGEFAGARPYLERALAIRERVLGPDHPETAESLNDVGFLLQALGDLTEARPYFERALAILENVLGPEHPSTALALNNVGGILYHLEEPETAHPYFKRALAIRQKVLGLDHPETALSLNNLGGLAEAVGDLSAARLYYERAFAILIERLGQKHPDTEIVQGNLKRMVEGSSAKGNFGSHDSKS